MTPPIILLVDDNDSLRAALRDWLGVYLPDVELVEAACGEDALAIAAVRPPLLVLMDIALPGMNGLDATQRLKARLPHLPVIILTLHEANEYRTQATVAGASAYVLKREMGRELLPVLHRLLAAGAGGRSNE